MFIRSVNSNRFLLPYFSMSMRGLQRAFPVLGHVGSTCDQQCWYELTVWGLNGTAQSPSDVGHQHDQIRSRLRACCQGLCGMWFPKGDDHEPSKENELKEEMLAPSEATCDYEHCGQQRPVSPKTVPTSSSQRRRSDTTWRCLVWSGPTFTNVFSIWTEHTRCLTTGRVVSS